ncbi:hypothetical protein [Nonomuraea sp. NPDC050540]|uniref:hypothetical protein n=1 Tax=Nonomuraea sp. NPDC050540 TaxID=3364367 RepID=UPI0037B8CCAC
MVLVGLGIRWNSLRRVHEIPDESTLRDLLETLDTTAFAAACGSWLADLSAHREQGASGQDKDRSIRQVAGRRRVGAGGVISPSTARHCGAPGTAATPAGPGMC